MKKSNDADFAKQFARKLTFYRHNVIIFPMKRQSELLDRQNDETALTLLRASENCLNRERYVKYLMIFMSFSICLAAIFNRYLPQMLPDVENAVEIQEIIATYINLISGVVLVCGIVLGFYVSRMHTEGTTLRDRYEAYVFDNAPNHSILRPIPKTMIEIYAKRTRRKTDDAFKNAIYEPTDAPSRNAAQFEFINREVRSDYKLYIYIQPFFLTIWIGFCILVMIIAVSFNDRFITTLINILIPSLSAISTIASSWHGCRLQIKQLQNLLNVIDEIQSMSENKRMQYISDKHNIRLLADGLYEYRVSPFVIPKFLIRRYQKSVRSGGQNVKSGADEIGEAAVTQPANKTGQKKTTAKKTATVQTAKVATGRSERPGTTADKEKTKPVKSGSAVNSPKTKGQEKTTAAASPAKTKTSKKT